MGRSRLEASATTPRMRASKCLESNRSALARQRAESTDSGSNVRSAATRLSASGRSKNAPVTPSCTVSNAPPSRSATTGRPAAWASTAAIPNSSVAVTTSALRPGQQLRRAQVGDAPGKANVAGGAAAQVGLLGAVSGDHQRPSEAVERLHGNTDALVGHELGEHEVIVLDRAGREARGLDRRMHDRRVAVEVAGNPLLGRVRVGNVAIDALGCHHVPLPPASQDPAQRRGGQQPASGERDLTGVPGVAERVVAVTDVHGVGVHDHPVRPRAGARDDELVPLDPESLGREWVEREQWAEALGGGAEPLQERCVNPAIGKAPFGTGLVIHRREQVGLRIHSAQRDECALRAPDIQEEVVDERDTASGSTS